MRLTIWAPVTSAVAVLLVACSSEVTQVDGGSGGSPSGGSAMVGGAPTQGGAGGGGDQEPPRVTLEAPTPGLVTSQQSVVVVGKATDASVIESVTVDGYPAISDDGFATFSAEVPVVLGENDIRVTARDVLGNEDPEAASVVVWGKTDSPPAIDAVFPGPRIAVSVRYFPLRVFASSPASVADVRVDGVSAVPADGGWLVEDEPTNQWTQIDVEDGFGTVTTTHYAALDGSGDELSRLTATGDGRFVGLNAGLESIVLFDPNAPNPYTLISGITLGSGPRLPLASDQILSVAWTADGILVAASFGGGELVGYLIDPATGARTLTPSCLLPSEVTAAVTDGERFYATTESGLYVCDPEGGVATFLTSLDFRSGVLQYDAIHDRIVAAGFPTDPNYTNEIASIDRLSGEVTPIFKTADGLQGFNVVDGEVYVGYKLGLHHVSESGALELIIPNIYTETILGCSVGDTPAFCLGDSDPARWVLGPSGWVNTPISTTYAAGIGPMPAESTSIAFVDGPMKPFILVGANPTVLTSLDGVRTPTALSAGSELRVLAGGTGVAGEGGVFTRFQASADGVDAISVVPGPVVTVLSAFELAPANTWGADPVIVYLTPTELRYRTLSGGDQLIATVASGNGLAVTDAGAVYVSTLFEGVTTLMRAEPGQPLSTMGSLPVSLAGMVYDPREGALVTPTMDIVSLPDLAVKHIDLASFDPAAPALSAIRPGPFTRTYWTVLDGRDWALVDVDHKAVFTMAR
ncbi:MAG: hypothetical protein U0271_45020 [Polyangiaceae bacterium]